MSAPNLLLAGARIRFNVTRQPAAQILADYPYLERNDITVALLLTAWCTEAIDVPLL